MKKQGTLFLIAILQLGLLSAVAGNKPTADQAKKRPQDQKTISKELVWDPNRPEERIARYNVYEQVVDKNHGTSWKRIATVRNPRCRLRVKPGTHVFAVSAVGPTGESQRSQELVVRN